jgi:ABC-type cobalamin/Fe3+-siderophores transport system ATPase subunit
MFRRIQILGWRQFDHVDIDLHPRVTVITGANGSGKTSILNLLAAHFQWAIPFVSQASEIRPVEGIGAKASKIGSIEYSDGAVIDLIAQTSDHVLSFPAFLPGLKLFPGAFIPSHLPPVVYYPATQLPTNPPTANEILREYTQSLKNRFMQGATSPLPSFFLKSALISFAVFGYGSQVIRANSDLALLFEGFQAVLSQILPKEIGFEALEVKVPEVLVRTRNGRFPLEAISGGLASLVDYAWETFLLQSAVGESTVLIDEPENHLHPSMQRRVMPALTQAFPRISFVVATHSPFIVSSIKESMVFVLRFNAQGKIFSEGLSAYDKSGSANDILKEVLGVPITAPLWAEQVIEQIIDKFRGEEINDKTLEALRAELREVNLAQYVPESIFKLLSKT